MIRSVICSLTLLLACGSATSLANDRFRITLGEQVPEAAYDGRMILIITPDGSREPRFQVSADYSAPQIFGVTVDGLKPGGAVALGSGVLGFPVEDMAEVPAGEYTVQAVLHKYDTYTLGNGKTVKLPAARGAGQNWRLEPGNVYSLPQRVTLNPAKRGEVRLRVDQVIPPIEPLADTPWIRRISVRSERLSEFWGRDVYINGHVLVPKGFDENPDARYPLAVFHGHFPDDFGGFRTTPPDEDLECVPNARFNEPCYNRIEQEEAYRFYQKWASDDFPRMLIVEIDHSNPYYDDSYAVNSANLGPYGDAITYEFIPALEAQFRGIGEGWARFLYGGSTGGWSALAAQMFYPDEYNGAFAACPDPIDFRQMMVINLYEDENAYWQEGPFTRLARPAKRNYLGHLSHTVEMENRWELVLGDKTRSGQQWDVWEAVYSPMGEDGYPRRIWDKRTGKIDREVAAYWRENYDLRYILERDWAKLAPKLQGKIHLYMGDMDNFYLNNAMYLMEEFLQRADPPYGGELLYGDRAEHCWNGNPDLPNAVTRLHYNWMYIDKILKRIEAAAPAGADLRSWRY